MFGRFPPAYVADASGKPMHSWRVLILPYLERDRLYRSYNFKEPWNGPDNQKLLSIPLKLLRCPGFDEPRDLAMTNYVAVTGPGTAWPGETSTKLANFRDGTENTILLVEIPNSQIYWSEPRDVTLDELLAANESRQPLSHHSVRGYFVQDESMGTTVAMANGSVHCIPGYPSQEDLKALLTIDGGEGVDIDNLDVERPPRRIHWAHCVGLAIFVVSVILLAREPIRFVGFARESANT